MSFLSSSSRPLVSVVIPTYNRARTLGRAIRSVLDQTFKDLELIVVDDGSTDSTACSVQRYQEPRLRYLRHAVNRNGSVARNSGIAASRGEYIAFLDSDDEWLPRKLELQLRRLGEVADDWAVCYTGFLRIREGVASQTSRAEQEGYLGKELLYRHLPAFGSTGLVERSCFERVGRFNESLPCHQDWDMALRLARRYRIAAVPEPLARIHISENRSARTVETGRRLLLAEMQSDLSKLPLEERRQILANHHRHLARLFALEHAWIRALGYGLRAGWNHPATALPRSLRFVLRRLRNGGQSTEEIPATSLDSPAQASDGPRCSGRD